MLLAGHAVAKRRLEDREQQPVDEVAHKMGDGLDVPAALCGPGVDGHVPQGAVREHARPLARLRAARQVADAIDHIVDRLARGVDENRIIGGDQRRGGAARIELVAVLDIGQHFGEIDRPHASQLVLAHAAAGTLFIAILRCWSTRALRTPG